MDRKSASSSRTAATPIAKEALTRSWKSGSSSPGHGTAMKALAAAADDEEGKPTPRRPDNRQLRGFA